VEGELLVVQRRLLRARWPELQFDPEVEYQQNLELEFISGSVRSLCVRHIQLASRHDPLAEAELQASSIPRSARVTLYGFGLGELPRLLLARAELSELRVVVLNRALLALVLEHVDMRDWLVDPRVHLSLAHAQASYVNRRFAANISSHVERLAENSCFVDSDRNVMELFGTHAGSEAYVVGAGPSLLQTISRLQEATARATRSRPIIVAADTALRTLLAHDVTPNFVVAMDPYLKPEYLPAQGSEGIGLVYFPLVPGAIVSAWGGPRYLALSNSPLYASLLETNRGVLWAGGSVIHPAVDLAVQLGARSVTLFGVDFAFVGGRTHAGWENGELGKDLLRADHWVMNSRGEKVRSSVNFASYLCALEDYIEARPSVRFSNSSEAGAAICGAPFLEQA
jgi:hypothetical protein